MVRFQTFRRALLGIVSLISLSCIALSVYLSPCIPHKSCFWVLIGIPGLTLCGCSWSILRKPIFKSPQLVAVEAAASFILLPLESILTLFVLAIAPTSVPNEVTGKVYFALEIHIFVTVAVVFLYTTGLITTAILTSRAFDTNVWSRDIDSSPSPFPMLLLFAYVFPCWFDSPSLGNVETINEEDHDRPGMDGEGRNGREARSWCMPGCDGCRCSPRKGARAGLDMVEEDNERVVLGGSRSRSLVRIPNEVERRTSIMIAFDSV